jgi:predicted  nucleic acid-binding Zn-ribbon protein
VTWNDLDMELEEWRQDFDRRLEEGRREIRGRIEKVESRCRESEEVRRREWEQLKGRVMTAQEEQRHHSDGVLRLMSAMTNEYLNIARSIGEELRQGFAEGRKEAEEGRAQLRANTEAVWRVLDRLPPPETD